jgi:hypothetical protein
MPSASSSALSSKVAMFTITGPVLLAWAHEYR